MIVVRNLLQALFGVRHAQPERPAVTFYGGDPHPELAGWARADGPDGQAVALRLHNSASGEVGWYGSDGVRLPETASSWLEAEWRAADAEARKADQ